MPTKTDELRELFERLSPQTTFIERQQRSGPPDRTDHQLNAALRRLVAEMRERYGFKTSLDDAALATLVRGFYAGRSDRDIASQLNVERPVVSRARIHLQLLRQEDLRGPVDLRTLATLQETDATIAECAALLDVSQTAVRQARLVLSARREAQRTGYYYQQEFESLLQEAGVSDEMAHARREDRDVFTDVFD